MEFNLSDLNKEFPLKDASSDRDITNLGDLVSVLIPYIFGIAGLILLLMLIFSGFQLLTSAGDPKALESGQKRLTSAVIGFIIIFLSYWIVKFVGQILGVEIFAGIFGN